MNEIIIVPKEIDIPVTHEGIVFSNCTFIDIYIDGVSIEELEAFESGVVYWEQFQQSIEGSGEYLLFTCYCGIAEDAGWDSISVKHQKDSILWRFERELESQYEFRKADYIEQVESCKGLLNLSRYPLAITNAIFPS